MASKVGVTDSQFYMWRTLFAIAHADHIVTDEEVRFMAEALEDVDFSAAQYDELRKDIAQPQNIELMYVGITDIKDQALFFKVAHELVHIDGDYGLEEQTVMLRLKELHVQTTDLDSLIGEVSLEFDDDSSSNYKSDQDAKARDNERQGSFKETLFAFKNSFLKH
jgi:hypothetical protein